MQRVAWTDNVCTVGGTCVHGYFTIEDIEKLFELCPEGHITPTYYDERLGPCGYGLRDLDLIRSAHKKLQASSHEQHKEVERGYYFTFMEADGLKLLEYLGERFVLQRGQPG